VKSDCKTFGQVVCQCALVSCKQWFLRVLFPRISKQSRKGIVPFSSDLVSKMDGSIMFVEAFVEFIDFVFVYSCTALTVSSRLSSNEGAVGP